MIHLEKVNWENYKEVINLNVTKEQENFVASNTTSLIHAYLALSDNNPVFAYAIYNDETVVGFISIGYDNDWSAYERDNWLESDTFEAYDGIYYYFIWRFMIDEKYQHMGYGKEALRLALEFIKTEPCGKAEYISISYDRNNEVAKKLYFSFGFYEPSEFEEYYEPDDEFTALLKMQNKDKNNQ